MTSSRLIRGDDSSARVVAWQAPGSAESGRPRQLPAERRQRRDRPSSSGPGSKGFEQGRAAGLEAGTREFEARIGAVEKILDTLARPLEDLDHRVEAELLALVQAVVRQLVRREMHQDPDT